MIKAMSRNGNFEVIGTEIERSIDGSIVWIENEEDVFQCLVETIEEVKTVENKKDIVNNILTLRESLQELLHQNKISYSDYQAYASKVGFKGTVENTKVWLMRKTKQELNNIINGLNKTLVKFN